MNDYRAYMLRMWHEDKLKTHRYSLESPVTGERIGFANLAALVTFLSSQSSIPQENHERGHDE